MTDEARLQRWIAARGGGRGPHPSEHIDMDMLTAHARGELPALHARAVEDHLYVCEDGRCPDFVREQGGVPGSGGFGTAAPSSRNGSAHSPVSSSDGGMHDRTFQSREIIWSTFESMSRELDVGIDELVNEAMIAYAKVRGYPVSDPPGGATDAPTQQPKTTPRPLPPQFRRDPLEETQDAGAIISPLDRSYAPARAPEDPDDDDLARTSARGSFARPPGPSNNHRAPLQPRGLEPAIDPIDMGEETRTAPRMNAIPKGRMPSPVPPGPPTADYQQRVIEPYAAKPPPLPPRSFPPTTIPMPGAPNRGGGMGGMGSAPISSAPPSERRLGLSYQGRTYGVEKDRFLLGRSKTQSDLRLDDPNVSRQHAVIEKVGPAFYLVDLGSTNGVHIAGERIARRALADGDVITITSHEIRVTLR